MHFFIVATSGDTKIILLITIKDMDTVNLKLLIIGDSGTGKSRYDTCTLDVLGLTTVLKFVNFQLLFVACC